MARRFIIFFILGTLVYGGFVAANFAVVYFAGETRSYADIARIQQTETDTLYGPVFNNGHGDYKYALLEARPHEVVVAGSSRALQYRQAFFTKPMVNCGRILSSVRTALNFFEHMAKEPPRTIIVLADFWWFRRPLCPVTGGHQFTRATGSERSLDMFFKPAWYVLQGKINVVSVVKNSSLLSKNRLIGLQAMEFGRGFRADGSFFSPVAQRSQEDMVAVVKGRIGATEFTYHDKLQAEALDAFFAKAAELERLGHVVVVIFPPLSPAWYEEISTNKGYGYVSKTVNYAHSFGALDYQNPARLGLTSNEFKDSLHTTSRADAMVLRDVAKTNSRLRQVLDLDFIDTFLGSGKRTP